MRKLLTHVALFLVAVVSLLVLAVFALVVGVVNGIRYRNLLRSASDSFGGGAYALDVFGNVGYATLLNALFAGQGGYLHGNKEESISSVLGKRWTQGTNSLLGEGMTGFLNLVDRGDHCYRAALNHDPAWPLPMPSQAVAWWKTGLALALILLMVILLLTVIF